MQVWVLGIGLSLFWMASRISLFSSSVQRSRISSDFPVPMFVHCPMTKENVAPSEVTRVTSVARSESRIGIKLVLLLDGVGADDGLELVYEIRCLVDGEHE